MRYRFASPVLLGCLLVACGPQDPPAPNVVTVVATDFGYEAPEQIPAGVTTVRMVNAGAEPHHTIIARLDADRTVDDLLQEYGAENLFPEFVAYMGGPGEAMPGDTSSVTVALEPGHYVLLCYVFSPDGAPHFTKGMLRRLEVVESEPQLADEPTPDVTVVLADYAFGFSGPVPSGDVTFRVENAGPQVHDLVIVQTEPGKSVQEFLAWMEAGGEGPPPGHVVSSITGMNAGHHVSFTAHLEPGEYTVLCWVPDVKDLRPHFMYGMMQQFTVS
ncbi:MAG: hypothetical protein JSW43_03410 [Gemmatimonadota bacterium]|nr:MAG: hypothetical protein JSW43_03410 [Gemmatimonadota bacterium]